MIAKLIQQLPAWQGLEPQQIVDLLNAETIEVKDEQMYTWAGIALTIGPEAAESFRVYLETNNMGWVVHQLGGSGIQLSNPLVQEMLLGFSQAGLLWASTLMLTGRRMVSLMTKEGLEVATVQNVEAGLLTIRKQQLEDAAVNRLQTYREALSSWDGSGEEPVL